VRAVRAKVYEARAALANAPRRSLGALGAQLPAAPPPTLEEMIEFFLGLLQSDIGYFFLDRTRIRPKGFRLG
jgi:hypothetical protein